MRAMSLLVWVLVGMALWDLTVLPALVARAREEAERRGPREGMLTAASGGPHGSVAVTAGRAGSLQSPPRVE
jgi:hypothetical protein